VDAPVGNYRLREDSPCIDMGSNVYAPTNTTPYDLDGNPRINDGTVDMGAYEFYEAQDDTDGDGLPDWWEEQYFSGATNANPDAICSNGVNTVMEAYIAGLNPNDPNAAFLISLRQYSPQAVLEWNATSGRVYSVYWTSNLLNGFGSPMQSNYTGGVYTDETHNAEEKGFYKIDVKLSE